MKKFFFVFFAFVFISCADGIKGSWEDDGDVSSSTSSVSSTTSEATSNTENSNSGSYSSVSGGTFSNTTAGVIWTLTFESDGSVRGSISGSEINTGYKWEENGKEVVVYFELGSTKQTVYTFTANSSFTSLTHSQVYSKVTLKRE